MEQKISFSFYKDKNINTNVFKELPGFGDAKFLKFPVTKKATKVDVYISSFREKYIEKDHLLELTELNDDSKISSVDYLGVQGYSQDLYLLKYDFDYGIPGRKGNLLSQGAEAVIFFSVKHNGRGDTIGVTSCYFGIIDGEDNVIAFDTPLSLKKSNGNFYFKILKKTKDKQGLLFLPANFPISPNSKTKLNIQKVVKLDPGKIGGYKPLVFDIAKIFHDPTALQFHFETTLHITQ